MKNKKLMLFIGIPVGIIVLLAAVFALFFLPPSADSVCKKAVTIGRDTMKKTLGDDAANKLSDKDILGATVEECAKKLDKQSETKGLFKTNTERRCILNAKDSDGFNKCLADNK